MTAASPEPIATTLSPGVIVIDHLLTREECAELRVLADATGYDDAPITTATGFSMRKDVRNNDRAIVDDADVAASVFQRARPHLPDVDGRPPIRLNERLRFYRYRAGQRFDWHSDGYYETPDHRLRSVFTFMVYLSEGCEGGATQVQVPSRLAAAEALFAQGEDPVLNVVPVVGRALVFLHPLRHTGAEVTAGEKHVLRSDVMYEMLERSR